MIAYSHRYYDDKSFDGSIALLDFAPLMFTVASFSLKAESWSPNPAAVSQVINGQAQGMFNPSSVTSSPYFVTYTWTTAGVWYSPSGTPGTFEPWSSYAIGWTQDEPTTTFSAQFFTPGQYLLEVQCVANVYSVYNGSLIASFTQTAYIGGSASDIDTGGGSGGGTAQANGSGGGDGITVVPAVVTFSDTSLIKLGLGAPTAYWKQITATVTPANQVTNVSFGATNGEVSVDVAALNPATGLVYLDIDAVSETPPGTHGTSDCNVTANDIGSLTSFPPASVPVIVYKPTSIGRPHDPNGKKTYTVKGKPLFVTSETTPALENTVDSQGNPIPQGWGVATTQYRVPTTIIVWDQFGHPLDPIFQGAPVFEGQTYINQNITGNGTYTDPVGFAVTHFGPNEDPKSSMDSSVVIWKAANIVDPLPPETDPESGDPSPVSIGNRSIVLNPNISGRMIQAISGDQITISWP